MLQGLNLGLILPQTEILVQRKFISAATARSFEGADVRKNLVVGLENGVFKDCAFEVYFRRVIHFYI